MKYLLIPIIKLYKRFLSDKLDTGCRHTPTCSVYALQAIEEWGGIVGGIMAIARIIRCNPFSRGGYHPVKRCVYRHRYTL